MSLPSKSKALFLNRQREHVLTYLREGLADAPIDFLTLPDDERETLMAILPEVDVLIGWRSDREMLQAASKLKLYINPGTGVQQHIATFRALRDSRPIPLANGHGNSYAVAQHTVALLMSLASKVIPHHQAMVSTSERVDDPRTTYLRYKTIGFLGYGAINKRVHQFLSGFDVEFAAYRRSWARDSGPFPTPLHPFAEGQLDRFFQCCDVVINSLPDTRGTHGLVGREKLHHLGKEGLFLNVGRGNTVVQEDLYRALKDGQIGGAGLDVWWGPVPRAEQVPNRPYAYPFHELENLVMSPHRAADAGGNLERWDEVIENLKRVVAGRTDFINQVDLDLEY